MTRNMKQIMAMYRISSVEHVFFISSLRILFRVLQPLKENKKRKECFEHILQWKYRIFPKAFLQWTLAIAHRRDLLSAKKHNNTKGQVSTNQTFHNPEDLELLTINLKKDAHTYPELNLQTHKEVSSIPKEDVIEIFI